jgi:hypothetical protein
MDRSHEILNGLKNLIGAAEEDGWDLTENADVLNKAREAYGLACDFFGIAPLEGDDQHQPADDTPEAA